MNKSSRGSIYHTWRLAALPHRTSKPNYVSHSTLGWMGDRIRQQTLFANYQVYQWNPGLGIWPICSSSLFCHYTNLTLPLNATDMSDLPIFK